MKYTLVIIYWLANGQQQGGAVHGYDARECRRAYLDVVEQLRRSGLRYSVRFAPERNEFSQKKHKANRG